MIAHGGLGGYRRSVAAVIHRLGRYADDGTVFPGGIGQRVDIDGEVRRDRNIPGHIRIGARVVRTPVAPVHKVITHGGLGNYLGAVVTVEYRLR